MAGRLRKGQLRSTACRRTPVRSPDVLPNAHGEVVYDGAGLTRKSYAWTDWLAQADLLTDGFRTSRGVTVMAKDGHVCRSLLERQIDDFFYDHGIEHETEPHYPFDPELNVTGYRADWKFPDGTFVEALGFPNDAAYMESPAKDQAGWAPPGLSRVDRYPVRHR